MLNIRKFFEGIGIVPKTSSTADTKGELEVIDSSGKLNYHNGSSVSPVVTEAHASTLTNKTIDADSNTITNIENADIKAGAAIDASKIADGSVSSTEFQYLANVTSDIQTQLNSKSSTTLTQDHILVGNASNVATGVDTTAVGDIEADATNGLTIKAGAIVNADINASAAIDATKIADGSVSNAEFQYLANVTSDIQTQLNNTVTASSTNTLTNKTIDGDNNTVQDLALSSLKTNLTDANKFLVRDGSGIVVSNTKDVPAGVVVGTTDTQTLTNKTIDGDDNTVQDLPLTAIKTNLTDASKFIVRDASGIPVSNTKAVPTGDVVGTTDTQTLTNKTLTTPTTDIVTWDDQASTPSNPSAGFYKTYFKTDGNLYKLNSSGVEAQVGGGVTATWTAYTPTFTGLGTVTNINMRYVVLDKMLFVMGRFQIGSASGTEARVSLPGSYTSSNNIGTVIKCGTATSDTSTSGSEFNFPILCEPNVTYFTMGCQTSAVGGLVKRNGNAFGNANETRSFFAIIEIQ